jgi:hypothetical protein
MKLESQKDEMIKARRMLRGVRRSELSSASKYPSDTEASAVKKDGERLSSANTNSTQLASKEKPRGLTTSRPVYTRPAEEFKFKWVPPVKDYSKYGPTKIQIIQDLE